MNFPVKKMNLKKKYILVVHYRNPYLYNAGSEKFITGQIRFLQSRGYSVITFFPVEKNFLAGKLHVSAWGVVENGVFYGLHSFRKIVSIVNYANKESFCYGVIIHSIINTNLEELCELTSFGCKQLLYLHDFCTCCKQYNLMKNNRKYCGSAVLEKNKCNGCVYFDASVLWHEEVLKMLNKCSNLSVVAPSELMKNMWVEAYPGYSDIVKVHPHQVPLEEWCGKREKIKDCDYIRIGFVGRDLHIKGYEIWKAAVSELNNENLKYKFFHIGHAGQKIEGVENVEVSVQRDGPDAMIKALRKNNIDVAVLFSLWPETYSYTYYECMASDCVVVTNKLSGNIAYQVGCLKNGIVLEPTADAFVDFLKNRANVLALINQYRGSIRFCPDHYEENLEYLKLLGKTDCIKEVTYSRNYFQNITTFFMNLLYRVRYHI